MKKFLKKTEGFTLVELIVVIAILGILTAIAVPTYSGYINKASEAADTQVVASVLSASQAALAEVNGTVSEVVIDLDDAAKTVVATVGTSDYVLVGTGVGAGSDADDAIETAARANYELFISGNTAIKFEQKVKDASGDKVTATKASWFATEAIADAAGATADTYAEGWNFEA